MDVDAIQVTVTVTDDHGQFVRDLKREQFQVFEDDAPQSDHATSRRRRSRSS